MRALQPPYQYNCKSVGASALALRTGSGPLAVVRRSPGPSAHGMRCVHVAQRGKRREHLTLHAVIIAAPLSVGSLQVRNWRIEGGWGGWGWGRWRGWRVEEWGWGRWKVGKMGEDGEDRGGGESGPRLTLRPRPEPCRTPPVPPLKFPPMGLIPD